jgi:hypothetical protein
VTGIWLAAVLVSALSHRRARRRQAWLRSDVPAKVAYARLRAEIERQQTEDAG